MVHIMLGFQPMDSSVLTAYLSNLTYSTNPHRECVEPYMSPIICCNLKYLANIYVSSFPNRRWEKKKERRCGYLHRQISKHELIAL